MQALEDVHSWRIDAYAVYMRPFNNYFEWEYFKFLFNIFQ